MALFAKDHELILKESIDFLTQNTNITSTGPGSKMRTLLEIMRKHLKDAYITFDYNTAVGFVYGARNQYLDYIGDIFGLTRRRSERAATNSLSETIKFYTYRSNFGLLNLDDFGNPQDIVIPSGTKIWAIKSGQPVIYSINEAVTLSKDTREAFASASAVVPGSFSNVQTGSIRYHDFLNYTDAKNQSLLVVNQDSIESGIDAEVDEDFRYRIINSRMTEATSNLTAIRLAALSLPGVADVVVTDRFNGLGTVLIYVKSTTPIVSQELISEIQDAVDEVKAAGIKVSVVSPTYTSLSFYVKPYYKPNTSSSDITNAETAIKQTIADYVNNLDVAEAIYINEIANRVLSCHPKIASIGQAGKFFEKITASLEIPGTTIVKTLIGDYYPNENEKLIISLNNPVTIL